MDIPLGTPPLPLEDAREDKESEGLKITFFESFFHIEAYVYNEDDFIIDIVVGTDFMDAYNLVREEYPQAKWENIYEIP